MKMYSKNYWP